MLGKISAHAQDKLGYFFKQRKSKHAMSCMFKLAETHPRNNIIHTLYRLKNSGKNFGLHKTAYKIRHIF